MRRCSLISGPHGCSPKAGLIRPISGADLREAIALTGRVIGRSK
jgi:hypothetical protein